MSYIISQKYYIVRCLRKMGCRSGLTSNIIKDENRPIIIADNIRTPENMGLILRLAGNIGAANTYFIADENQNFKNHKIKKTASGADSKVSWKIIKQAEILKHIPDDYKIIALETTGDSSSIYSFNFPKKTVFLVGNEVFGISSEVLALVHHKVYIPIPVLISSLNVTHALSVALFEWLRQMIIEQY